VHAIAIGFGLGLLVAAQLGPMSLLLIRNTLRGGLRTGLAIGAGIAFVDALYAAAGAAGAAPLIAVDPLRIALGVAGACVLVALGTRTLVTALRVRIGGEVDDEVAAPRRAFATAVAGTASNPLTIASWGAIFVAASAGAGAAAAPLVVGVALGSLTSVSALAAIVALARRALGPRAIRVVDVVAGLGLVGFGGALAYATARQD
jgi:putative LysE/RhtB family amino acid efflux pump